MRDRRAGILPALFLTVVALGTAPAQDAGTQEADGIGISLPPVVYRGSPSGGTSPLSVSYHAPGLGRHHEVVIAVLHRSEHAEDPPQLLETWLHQGVDEAEAGSAWSAGTSEAGAIVAAGRGTRAHGSVELELPADMDPAAGTVVAVVRSRKSGDVQAAAERAITTAPASIRGRVVRPDGDGAADVRILACGDYICVPALSAPDGSFAITGIPAGSYTLRVGTVAGRRIGRVSLASGEVHTLAQAVRRDDSGGRRPETPESSGGGP